MDISGGTPCGANDLSVALRNAQREIETLRAAAALETRTVIGQATGLLMRDLDLSAAEAFRELLITSSHTNVKVRDLASVMVEEANNQSGGVLGRLGLLGQPDRNFRATTAQDYLSRSGLRWIKKRASLAGDYGSGPCPWSFQDSTGI